MPVEAILFDMDGVLVDARDWHYEALNKALKLFGMEIGFDDHLASFDGLPTRKKLEIPLCVMGLIDAGRKVIGVPVHQARPITKLFH